MAHLSRTFRIELPTDATFVGVLLTEGLAMESAGNVLEKAESFAEDLPVRNANVNYEICRGCTTDSCLNTGEMPTKFG